MSVHRWHDLIYRKYQTLYTHTKKNTTKLLELINKFSQFVRYKINTQKSVVFLHTNKEQS